MPPANEGLLREFDAIGDVTCDVSGLFMHGSTTSGLNGRVLNLTAVSSLL